MFAIFHYKYFCVDLSFRVRGCYANVLQADIRTDIVAHINSCAFKNINKFNRNYDHRNRDKMLLRSRIEYLPYVQEVLFILNRNYAMSIGQDLSDTQ